VAHTTTDREDSREREGSDGNKVYRVRPAGLDVRPVDIREGEQLVGAGDEHGSLYVGRMKHPKSL